MVLESVMEEKRYTGLKILVIGMGVVLIAGFIGLAAVMVAKLHTSGVQPSTGGASPPVRAECPSPTVDLRAFGRVINTETQGNLLRLSLAKTDGTVTVVTLDSCSGEILRRLIIQTAR